MWNNQNQKKIFPYVKLTNLPFHFKLDFQKVDQHTGGKWLIHDTKRRKDNQLQSLIHITLPLGGETSYGR